MPEDRSQVNVRLPKSLLPHIKQSASDDGVTVSEWIKDACSKKLREGDDGMSSTEPSSIPSNTELSSMSSTSSNYESELEGKVSELEERLKLLEDNQTSHADRLSEVEENLEGLSCTLPDSGSGNGDMGNSPREKLENKTGVNSSLEYFTEKLSDGSVGNSPHNINPNSDLSTHPDYIYTANSLATELGIKPRTLREQLQKLEIGDTYPRNGKQYQILSKKPYKLVLIE